MLSGIHSKSEKTSTLQTDKSSDDDSTTNKRFFKKNGKLMFKSPSLDKKNFTGETTDMNGQLFQTLEESRDATQYVKTVETIKLMRSKIIQWT